MREQVKRVTFSTNLSASISSCPADSLAGPPKSASNCLSFNVRIRGPMTSAISVRCFRLPSFP